MHDFNHIMRVLATTIAETLWPTRCAACEMPGDVLCQDCARDLPFIDPQLACPACGAPFGALVCTECTDCRDRVDDDEQAKNKTPRLKFAFEQARCAVSYEGSAKRILKAYKDHDEKRLAGHIALFVLRAMRASDGAQSDGAQGSAGLEDWTRWADAVVAVPATKAAIRKRGYDHMQLIACELASLCGLSLISALDVSKKTADQRLLGSAERAANLMDAFSVRPGVNVPKRIVLVDDVFTTGATANAAAAALLAGGAEHVRVATFARVW